jgi:hypothetical protein
MSSKAQVARQSHGLEPELCGEILPVNVNVRRLVGFMAVEVKPIGPASQRSWHEGILLEGAKGGMKKLGLPAW